MRTRLNTSHVVTADPKHRRGWIPLRSCDVRVIPRDGYSSIPQIRRIEVGGYSATLRMSNLTAVRRIMPNDEVGVVIYQDGGSTAFRGLVTGGKIIVETFQVNRRKFTAKFRTTLAIEVDLIPNTSGQLFIQVQA